MTFILEEDSALKSYLTGLTVSDEKNSARPVNVWYGMPDIEVRDTTFPYLMIDLIDIQPAQYRRHAGGVYTEIAYLENEAVPALHQTRVRNLPEPFDLMYQVACYSRHPRHDRSLIRSLLGLFPGNRAIIPILPTVDIPDQYGNCRPAFLEEFAKADTIVEGKRLYRNVLTLRVPSELDPVAQDLIANVLSVRVNVSPNRFVPTSLDIV